jgi:hypothetical protein
VLGVDEKPSLTKRLRCLEEVKNEFWEKWFHQVFEHLIPCPKWRKEYRNMMVGDVVLMRDTNLVGHRYKLALVKEVVAGEDGKVRRVVLQYKNVEASTPLDKARFKETERSVHNVVVIVPVDWTPAEVEQSVVDGMAFDWRQDSSG